MNSIPAFHGHPDRPVDPPPKVSRRRKTPKSGNLFEQALEQPLPPPATQNAAATPPTATRESPTQADKAKHDFGTNDMAPSALGSPVQHDSVKASPGV
jgi:hypothetical protein